MQLIFFCNFKNEGISSISFIFNVAIEIPLEYTGASQITVTATSVFNTSVTGTASITVAS